MPKVKRAKKFAAVKRMISPKDPRLAPVKAKLALAAAAAAAPVKNVAPLPAAMFFSHNTALGPPYHILLDTNFINFAIKNKLEIVRAAMDCLLAKCVPVVTDCVIAELEKLGVKYRVALRVAKDPRFERLTCEHKGTYADDCIVNRVTDHRCYIVATCDKDLRRRLRKIPGVPCMFITQRKFTVERMPVSGAPRARFWGAPRKTLFGTEHS
jgi:U3 small nucleolar RNA-associated protein 24